MKKQNENATLVLQLVEVDQRKFAVEWKAGVMNANLTQMAKPFGKTPKDWLRTDEAKRYLNALSVRQKCLTTDLVRIKNGGRINEQGTWACDHNITVEFARWLDPMFAIKVNELFWDLFTGKSKLISKEENRKQLPPKRLDNRLDRDRLIRLLTLTSKIEDKGIRIAITDELTGGFNYGIN